MRRWRKFLSGYGLTLSIIVFLLAAAAIEWFLRPANDDVGKPTADGDDGKMIPALIDDLKEGPKETRLAAARKLGELGRRAASSVPALIGALGNPDLAIPVLEALASMGEQANVASPAILVILQNGDAPPATRTLAAITLGRIGAADPGVIAALKAAAADPDPGVAGASARALRALGADR